MKVIGITGGVGSGKSEVLNYIGRHYEAAVVQADEAAHLLMQPGEACYPAVIKLLGPGFTDLSGDLDRKKMSSVIFHDEDMRTKMNQIVHPAVRQYVLESIEKERKMGTPLFFVEAALLIEDHYDEICDELWYIYADEQIRRERLVTKRRYSKQKMDEIMASQLSETEFSKHCDFEINNSGDLTDTIKQIDSRISTYETL
jgi:dephospho-CoA kinase